MNLYKIKKLKLYSVQVKIHTLCDREVSDCRSTKTGYYLLNLFLNLNRIYTMVRIKRRYLYTYFICI